MKRMKLKIIFATCAILTASGAFAQEQKANPPSGDPSVRIPGKASGGQDNLGWAERDSLAIGEIIDKCAPDSGFSPLLTWTGEQWSNLSGGIETGTSWDSLFTLGFEQDISKPAKLNNLGSIGLSAFYYAESSAFDDKLGAYSSPSNIFSGEMVRVFEIFYKNEFETEFGNIGFRVGQLAADEDFMGMDYADIFLNSSFGAIPANAGDSLSNGTVAFSQYSLATLGAVAYWGGEKFDATAGVYNGDCGEDVSGNHGFDYGLQNVAVWYQFGFNYANPACPDGLF